MNTPTRTTAPTPENDPLTPEMRAEIASWIRATANPGYTKLAQRFIDALVPRLSLFDVVADAVHRLEPGERTDAAVARAVLPAVRDYIAAVELEGPADRTTERFDQGWNSAKRTIIALFDDIDGGTS